MKKSIVAMLSITALATVANADPFEKMTGTNFEGKQNGGGFFATTETESLGVEDPDNPGSYLQGFYWFASTNSAERGAQLGTYTNSQEYGSYNGPRPAIAAQVNTTNSCLLVDTEGERLFRAIEGRSNYDDDDSTFVQFDVTSTVYFDSLVQFTVNEDEAPTIQTGDKLAVWLKGGDTTNLVITAGYVDSSGGVTPTNYVIDAAVKEVLPGVWYRLTIESFLLTAGADAGNGYIGFRVRIDGDYLTTTQAKMGGSLAECVSEMSGAQTIDEPTAEEWQKLFPSLAVANGEVDNCDTLSCVAFEGTGAVDDLTFTPNDPFAGAAPAVPTVDGNEPTDGDAFIAAATSGTVNILPTGWTLDGNTIKDGNGDDYAVIPAFYTATLTDGTLTLVLNTAALPTIGAATIASEEKEAIEVGDTKFTATLTGTEAKLYYGLSVATTPNPANWPAPASLTKGTGSAMQLTADKPVDGSTVAPAAFFKVYVTDIAPETPTP